MVSSTINAVQVGWYNTKYQLWCYELQLGWISNQPLGGRVLLLPLW